jgi:hypothetical protein
MTIRAGHALFFVFALALSRSRMEHFALALLRFILGLKFRTFAFALPRSLFFMLVFRASTFALPISFRTRTFKYIYIYIYKKDRPNGTGRTGQTKGNRQNEAERD